MSFAKSIAKPPGASPAACCEGPRLSRDARLQQPAVPLSTSTATPTTLETSAVPPSLAARARSAAAAVALSASLALCPVGPGSLHARAQSVAVSNDVPVLDLARVIPSGRLDDLQRHVKQLEGETGWRVRVLTRFGPSDEPSVEELRAGWSVDERTIVVLVDPSSPNILNFKFGREVRQVLRPQFFTELQGRFGNMFNVREEGESAAVMAALDALTGCLAAGGCAVVPGLTSDHYLFTLAVSVAGGVVAGAAARLEPQGFVQRRGVWVLLFAPLWATLFVNFGLGPVVTRTDDIMPVLGNLAGFAAAAAAVGFQDRLAKAAGLAADEPKA